MEGIVETQAPHSFDILCRKRGEEVPYLGYLIGHFVLAKYVALDDAGLLSLDGVSCALGEDCVAVVGATISGEEADEALWWC